MQAVVKLSALALLALVACIPEDKTGVSAGGGASGATATGGSGTASSGGGGGQSTGGGTTGTAGSSGGQSSTGGATGAAGSSGGAAGAGVAPAGQAGRAGAAAGTSGRGGASSGGTGPSAGGAGGRGGAGGLGGSGGMAGGATGSASSGDDFVSNVGIAVHPQTTTILVVTWTQAKVADQTWLEFTFAGGSLMTSRPAAGATGAHRDVVLGVPASTAITVRIINKLAGVDYKTKDYQGTTGAIPSGMPKPTVMMYDATLASSDRWLFGAVENSKGGCNNISCYYTAIFWLYIIDRQGRIVWYYADGTSDATTSFQRIARDGEYIWIERRPFSGSGTHERPQDDARPPVFADGAGSQPFRLHRRDHRRKPALRHRSAVGTARADQGRHRPHDLELPDGDGHQLRVLLEHRELGPAERLDRHVVSIREHRRSDQSQDGLHHREVRPPRPAATRSISRTGASSSSILPNISSRGTLMVSSHLPGYHGRRARREQALVPGMDDRSHEQEADPEVDLFGRPRVAHVQRHGHPAPERKLPGQLRHRRGDSRITPDKKTVFYVKFDVTTGDDFFNKMVGNNVLVNDLYALNGGGPK